MKKIQELTIGFVIFLLLDRFARAISTTIANGSDEREIHKTQMRIELFVFALTFLIFFKLWF